MMQCVLNPRFAGLSAELFLAIEETNGEPTTRESLGQRARLKMRQLETQLARFRSLGLVTTERQRYVVIYRTHFPDAWRKPVSAVDAITAQLEAGLPAAPKSDEGGPSDNGRDPEFTAPKPSEGGVAQTRLPVVGAADAAIDEQVAAILDVFAQSRHLENQLSARFIRNCLTITHKDRDVLKDAVEFTDYIETNFPKRKLPPKWYEEIKSGTIDWQQKFRGHMRGPRHKGTADKPPRERAAVPVGPALSKREAALRNWQSLPVVEQRDWIKLSAASAPEITDSDLIASKAVWLAYEQREGR